MSLLSTLGYFVSSISDSPKLALAITPGLITPMLLFGGLFLENGSVPAYIDWLRYISWFMYGNEALSVNQWDGVTFNNSDCQYLGYNVTDLPPSTPNATVEFIGGLYSAYKATVVCSGNDILDQFNFNPVFRSYVSNEYYKSLTQACFRIFFLVTSGVWLHCWWSSVSWLS